MEASLLAFCDLECDRTVIMSGNLERTMKDPVETCLLRFCPSIFSVTSVKISGTFTTVPSAPMSVVVIWKELRRTR